VGAELDGSNLGSSRAPRWDAGGETVPVDRCCEMEGVSSFFSAARAGKLTWVSGTPCRDTFEGEDDEATRVGSCSLGGVIIVISCGKEIGFDVCCRVLESVR
jgi:hypothetical protein